MRHRHNTGQRDWASEPMVSIIVTTYNRRDLLPIALRSVVQQRHRNLECVVVNDAGEDVRDIVEGLHDERVRLITHEANCGLARARNTGIDAARGEYIGFLDDDDRLYTGHVRKLLAAMRETGADMAYADADKIYLDKQEGQYVEVGKELARDGGAYGSHDFDHSRIMVENYIPVECHLTAGYVFETVRFDEAFNPYEDWEFLIAVSRWLRPHHLAEATSAFTERTDKAAMLASGTADNKRRDAVQRIYQKWSDVGPQLAQLRQQIVEGETNRVMHDEQLRDLVEAALAAPDVSAYVKARQYWQAPALHGYVYTAMKRAEMANDSAREERLNLLLGAVK